MIWKDCSPCHFFSEPHIARVEKKKMTSFFNRYDRIEIDIFMVILGTHSCYYSQRVVERMGKYNEN